MKKEESKTAHRVYLSNSNNLSKRVDQKNSSISTDSSQGRKLICFLLRLWVKKIKGNQNFKSLPHVSEILIYTSRVQKTSDWKLI